MTCYVMLAVGFIAGLVSSLIINSRKKPDGIFRINLSDPMKDVFTLEFIRPIEGVQDCKFLIFKVVDDSNFSREKQGL